MNKLLIGAILALLLLALIPIKSETFTFTNSATASASFASDTTDLQNVLIQIDETNQLDNNEQTLAENIETDDVVNEIGIEQEIADNDRNIFISIGAILLFGILLLLPLHLQRF